MSRVSMRRAVPGVIAVLLLGIMYLVAKLPSVSAATINEVVAKYNFTQMPIAMPPGYHQTQDIRKVNPAYYHVRSWISSVGAAVALTDLTGQGVADDMCIVDPRTDDVIVTYAPTAPSADRFTPFVLNPAPLPTDSSMAPTSCTPGDFNGDGRMDLLVTYLGRTPIIFLAKSTAHELSASAYKPVELMQGVDANGRYYGPHWNSTTVNVADYDGTGHPDIFVGNYFPDSDVLSPNGQDNVQMNSSMSWARNGGGDHVFRWTGATSGPDPTVNYVESPGAIPYEASSGWTLAVSSADLTGDGLPDVYVANDFGTSRLLYNVSTPGHIRFQVAVGSRNPTTPKSFVLGRASFKGMGIDFGDMQDNGRFDMVASDIATNWALEEGNFAWINTASSGAQMTADLSRGYAPFSQEAEQLGLAWGGWGWDMKMGDFLNDGNLDVIETDGFIQGTVNRWPWLQELAMENDDLLSNPANWPNMQPGDDIAGHQTLDFFARDSSGGYVNISRQLGLAVPVPTRGVALADTRGDGRLDFAVARQWAAPAFYANNSADLGNYLGLNLYRPAADSPGDSGGGLSGLGTPAYGATVQISFPGHTQISQLDGGGGTTGRRSFEVSFGLGGYRGPVSARIQWRDTSGGLHQQTLTLMPGTHNLLLTSTAQEVQSR